jgi:mitochondrial fission protein ELM1
LRSHGEFERNAKLSEAAHEQLDSIVKRVEANGTPSFAFMSRATDDTAAVLTSELSDWRFVFWGKPLVLPG